MRTPGSTPRLLLVEDDRQLSALVSGLLSEEGYLVEAAADGQRGLHLALSRRYDLLVLDRGLPAIDGLDLLTRLRSAGVTTPALVLSALANPADRVDGLNAGAEDYLGKPFAVEELLARLQVLLRRRTGPRERLAVAGGRLDPATRSVRLDDGGEVALTTREAALLTVLASSPGQVHSRRALLRQVFDGHREDNLVDTYVSYLRRKLGRDAVVTVRGLGYRLGRP